MVTSPHEQATQAGADVLEAGGNAIEAAIAIGACLNVTYPHFSGFGGDAFLLVSDRSGKVRSISGIGQAARDLPTGLSDAIAPRGPGSMLTTAGAVDALGCAFELSREQYGGARSWSDLLAPAIRLAEDGFPMSPSQRFWLDFRAEEMAALPGVFSGFTNDGDPPDVGATFRQPRLAASLQLLAARGHRDFYEGKLAARIAAGLQAAGSPLSASDLAATRARVEEPIRLPYRDGTLVAHRPPTQGITTLEIMGILDRFDLRSMGEGSADHYHLLVEAVKRAFLDRNEHVADPECANVPSEFLLSAANLDAHAAGINMGRALPWPDPFHTGDTVFIGATDQAGNAVSMLQTIYFDWGSGVEVGDTGMLWHNRGAAFSLDADHPNVIAPGKRPFHTLNPGMYLQDGRPRVLYGTQGADGQPQTLATILTRIIDYGMDPLSALAKPRFLLGKTFSDATDSLKVEEDAGGDVLDDLRRRGHELSLLPPASPLAGHPGAITIDTDGVARGAHDPRSDGRAIGL